MIPPSAYVQGFVRFLPLADSRSSDDPCDTEPGGRRKEPAHSSLHVNRSGRRHNLREDRGAALCSWLFYFEEAEAAPLGERGVRRDRRLEPDRDHCAAL